MRTVRLKIRRVWRRNGRLLLGMLAVLLFVYLYTAPSKRGEPLVKETTTTKPSLPHKEKDAGPKCELTEVCGSDMYAYSITAGSGREEKPRVCFDGKQMEKPYSRGFNIIIFDFIKSVEKNFKVFDLYTREGDDEFAHYMSDLNLAPQEVLIGVSVDEMSSGFSTSSRRLMAAYGAKEVEKLHFRDNYIFIGQFHASSSAVLEKLQSKPANQDFPPAAQAKGCIKLPMETQKVESVDDTIRDNPDTGGLKGNVNCGLKEECPANQFSVHLYSGKGNTDNPRICINGKYYMDKGVNGAGRGFNIVVFSIKSRKVRQTANFDTYSKDSTAMELFLESVQDGELVIAVTNDDAASKLGNLAKKIWEDMGSGGLQNLDFRDNWSIITRKGLKGFTPFEEIRYKMPDGSWPDVIDFRKCVEYELKGQATRPVSLGQKNALRRKFCKNNDGYTDFCDAEHIDSALDKALLTDSHLQGNAIFDVPIVVVPGFNNVALVKQLQSILAQPGIVPENVVVTFDEVFKDHGDLAQIFGFRSVEVTVATKFQEKLISSMKKAFEIFPSSEELIVLEEDMILSLDFLNFMSQLRHLLAKDKTLATASAFNPNGYQHVSQNLKRVYRIEDSPGLAFMIRREVYQKYYSSESCCLKRAWFNWEGGLETLVPEVSRVYHTTYQGSSLDEEFLQELLSRSRIQHMNSSVTLAEVQLLESESYDEELQRLVSESHVIMLSSLKSCFEASPRPPALDALGKGKLISILVPQSKGGDYKKFNLAAKCFGLFSVDAHSPKGRHKDMIRFTFSGKEIMLIGSNSPFYKQART